MVRAYERLDHAGRRALLRREGLYNSLISAWRQQSDRGALAELGKQRGRKPADPVAREMARLRDENQRMADALSRAKQLIEFQGKISALLEQVATGGVWGGKDQAKSRIS
jgi:transposase-like protein